MPTARILPDIPIAISARPGLLFEHMQVRDIPLICCHNEVENRHMPVIFFSSGFEPASPDGLERLTQLIERGYYVVIVSHSGHNPPDQIETISHAGRDRRLLVRRWQVYISRAARDISALVDDFTRRPQFDISRIGMIGTSLGGLVAWRALLTDPRIKLGLALMHPASHLPMELPVGQEALPYPPLEILPAGRPASLASPSPQATTACQRRSAPARRMPAQRLNFIVQDPDNAGSDSAAWMKALAWVEYYL